MGSGLDLNSEWRRATIKAGDERIKKGWRGDETLGDMDLA